MKNTSMGLAPAAFAFTMFASAALIFMLQPLFARMVTPLLGGSPAVWNTAMVFFQAALLIGYAYAHALVRRIGSVRTQALVHAAVIAAGVTAIALNGGALRLDVSDLFGQPDTARPILWLLSTLAVSVGLPFAALAATAPLLQAWYTRTGREDAADPYYLYAASNLGSMLGLLLYPIAAEPLLGLTQQREIWAGLFVLTGAAVLACGFLAAGGAGAAAADSSAADGDEVGDGPPTWRTRLYWLAAAAVPSSLLLGVTQHITTDVASAPFLWVAPLSLYLLTFVIAFTRGASVLRGPVSALHPLALSVLIMAGLVGADLGPSLAAHLIGFFLAALVCHLALSDARPHASRLTEFYLYVSLGGVLGGAATALLAPVIFNDVYEYPLALAASALFLLRSGEDRPLTRVGVAAVAALTVVAAFLAWDWSVWSEQSRWAATIGAVGLGLLLVASMADDRVGRWAKLVVAAGFLAGGGYVALTAGDRLFELETILTVLCLSAGSALMGIARTRAMAREAVMILAFTAAAIIVATGFMEKSVGFPQVAVFGVLGLLAVAIIANRARPLIAGALALAAFGTSFSAEGRSSTMVFKGRSFFGVTEVFEYDLTDGRLRHMVHGTTTHGAQYVTGARTREPLTYYNAATALGHATIQAVALRPQTRLGMIGLGAGSTACHRRAQDALTIFEIDPMVVRFSTQSGLFTYVPNCAPGADVRLGDARLKVAELAPAALDVLVVDAFSSDAVPAHLLTTEAVRMFMDRLSDTGVLILHLSNRHLDLIGEASRVATETGFPAVWTSSAPDVGADGYTAFATSTMVLTKNEETMRRLALEGDWSPPAACAGRPWSDEYVNLARALLNHCVEP